MYDLFKTPEQKKKENKQALIVMILIFGIPIMFALVVSLLASGNSLKSASSSNNRSQCSTITEPYSGIEHEVDCEGDYDRYGGGYDDYFDDGWQDAEYEYEMQKKQEEWERKEDEYWEEYCNDYPYECV